MLQIAICDDDRDELMQLTAFVQTYIEQYRNKEIRLTTFESGLELLHRIEYGGGFDIILLDVLMPGLNGMQTARELRAFDKAAKLIFLTSSPEFAVESYTVGAFYYALKPTKQEALFPVLDKVFGILESEDEDSIIVKSKSGIVNIALDSLVCVEVYKKTLAFHTVNGEKHESYGILLDYERILLQRQEFFKVHRSYIANLLKIKRIGKTQLEMKNGMSLPISRKLVPKIKEIYLDAIFAKGGNT